MPLVLAGLADMLLDVCMILACLFCAWAIAHIASVIPNPSYLGFKPLSFIPDTLNDLASWFNQEAASSLGALNTVITDCSKLWNDLTNYCVNAIYNTISNVDYLYNTHIPAAVANAESYAEGIVSSLRNDVSQDVTTINAGVQGVRNDFDSFESFVSGAFHANIESDISHAASSAISTTESYTDNATNALTQTLQSDLASVWDSIGTLQTAVSSTIPNEIANAYNSVESDLATAKQALYNDITNQVNSLQTELTTVESQLNTEIQNGFSAAAAAAAADLSTAEGYATAQAAAAAQAVANAAATALQATATIIGGKIDTLTNQLDTIGSQTAIDVANIGTLQGITGIALPAAIAAVASSVASITREFDECAVTTCDGPNSLANALQGLAGLFTITGELGFLTAAIKDPVGTASALDDLLGPWVSDGTDLLDDLLSL